MKEISTPIELTLGLEKDKNNVRFRLDRIGRDWILFITGGKAHIGSIAVTEKCTAGLIWQKTLGIHKEKSIVQEAINRLQQIIPGELLVIGGIHYDDISKDQIDQILHNTFKLIDQLETMLSKK